MGGFVTWIGVGISSFVVGYEAIIAADPVLAAKVGGALTIIVGIARKIEKAIAAYQGD